MNVRAKRLRTIPEKETSLQSAQIFVMLLDRVNLVGDAVSPAEQSTAAPDPADAMAALTKMAEALGMDLTPRGTTPGPKVADEYDPKTAGGPNT
jgi:hypothetical protein